MNFDQIQAFITVVDLGSISRAAKALYTSQGSISKKIQSIEEELGVPLLVRGKGIHHVELTSYGESFFIRARQIDSLRKDVENIKYSPEKKYLSIGAGDSITNLYFNDFLHEFISKYPNISLSLHSYHSSQVYQKLNDHFIDLGYAQLKREQFTDVSTTELLTSPLVVITMTNDSLYDGMSIKELPADKELYIRMSATYEHWHDDYFPNHQYLMRVGTDIISRQFLDLENTWALTSETSAHTLQAIDPRIKHFHIKEETPSSSVFELQHRYSTSSRQNEIELFKTELRNYLRRHPLHKS